MTGSAPTVTIGPANSGYRVMTTSVSEFVLELTRAANEVDRLKPEEIGRLLDRAHATLADLREVVGEDATADDFGGNDKAALLQAAAALGDLRSKLVEHLRTRLIGVRDTVADAELIVARFF